MTTSEIMIKMINYSQGNMHDINHFLKVYGFAKTIGEKENLSVKEQTILEVAAILHDIACPLCREKYGNTNGKYQEEEGIILAKNFLDETDLSEEIKQRVVFLVGHHHTITDIVGNDYQILIEADYLVNANESSFSEDNIRNMMVTVFKTETGIELLKTMYLENEK